MKYNGYCLHSGFLAREGQEKLLLQIRALLQDAPLYTPQMPKTGRPMPARRSYHGVDRIYPGTSSLLAEGGRFNLALRRVNTS